MSGSLRRTTSVVSLLAVVSLGASASAQLLRCESIGGQRQVCQAFTANGVQLVRQLGGSSCVAGRTWGWSADSVWVEENCRGEFLETYVERPGQVVVTCDSDHKRVQRCELDTQYGLVVIPDDSSSNCVQGQTWGWEIGSVWVSERCAAGFAIATPELGRAVRCEALEGERTECPVENLGGGIALITQHSTTACVYGESWGVSETGIWVDPSCTATFLVDGRQRGTAYWNKPPRLVCGSPVDERDFCPVDTTLGIVVGTVTSTAACVENHTWGWTAQGLWTAGGCQAEFLLQR